MVPQRMRLVVCQDSQQVQRCNRFCKTVLNLYKNEFLGVGQRWSFPKQLAAIA